MHIVYKTSAVHIIKIIMYNVHKLSKGILYKSHYGSLSLWTNMAMFWVAHALGCFAQRAHSVHQQIQQSLSPKA